MWFLQTSLFLADDMGRRHCCQWKILFHMTVIGTQHCRRLWVFTWKLRNSHKSVLARFSSFVAVSTCSAAAQIWFGRTFPTSHHYFGGNLWWAWCCFLQLIFHCMLVSLPDSQPNCPSDDEHTVHDRQDVEKAVVRSVMIPEVTWKK